ncbi:DUF817 domain-containing protein [Celeribacter halophilus]|uniref:Uncharacterized membrane protein YoaT, DUF817 family n=1 Tax=Celeribacter halophilus TaxID=576117 RepID=A0A1I3MWC8_9RHOB|nr:DUF817 domain-containing protein [Celeribacter halophilus]PZX15553.1 uncharacterized membrane protein YoaT (DUF817 family) [Celeribacter halophilus]SFJ01424.1 Uncharacterized membrane protein YoaT, DUF817 family [Celeribacter halophilus]
MAQSTSLERRLGDWLRARLPHGVTELVMFTVKMGWASLFGGLLLIAMLVTHSVWQADWPIARYDALLVYALALQMLFLFFRMETLSEAKVILLFHLTGTIMEIFKLHMGSWDYPGAGLIKIGGVPLFSGFMYASVGSFMARAIRLFDMRFAPYPPYWASLLFAGAIYMNFFTHHFGPDIRLGLFAASLILYARTRVWYRIGQWHWMPMPVAGVLSAFFLWIAENIGTATKIWLYNGQMAGDMVGFSKIGSWYLLLYVSFVTVTLVQRDALDPQKFTPDHARP